MTDRRTGRTTKILQNVLTCAIAGEHVFFVVHRVDMIRYCAEIVCHLNNAAKQEGRNKITLPGGGVIQFLPQFSQALAFRDDGSLRIVGRENKVFRDHTVTL